MSNKFVVSTFKEFLIDDGRRVVNIPDILGKQLVNLFEVFLYYRNQTVHKDLLIEILWPESENPASALKFTIHRFRKEIQKIEMFKDLDVIITVKDGYMLNPELEWDVDFERLTYLWDKIKMEDELDDRLYRYANELYSIYSGKFYTTNSQLLWHEQICESFRQMYVKTVIKMCKFLIDRKRYDEMMTINYGAILLEPFYEGLHYYYMKGLLETSDYHKALKYYDDLNEVFVRELGTGLSDRFKELYNMIVDDHKDVERVNLTDLIKDLSKRTEIEGGFYCAFDMFKYIYELSCKVSVRDPNKNYYIISIEIVAEDGNDIKIFEQSNSIKYIIGTSLRSNDIFAKVNEGQFVILANCREIDNTYLIVQRISKKFYKKYRNKSLRMNYDVAKAELI